MMGNTVPALSGFKSLGEDGWIGFFSNIFPDRDVQEDAPQGERFTLKALEEYAEWANSDPANLPDLEFWHLPNVKMGKAVEVAVVGPFIVARGPWGADDIGQKAKAYFSSTEEDWSMSHGFKYLPWERIDGEYHRFRTYEVTVLPPEWAANSVTLFMEGTMSDVQQKGLIGDLKGSLAKLLGMDEATAEQVALEGLGQGKALIDAAKAVGAATGQKEGEPAATPPAPAEPSVEIGDDVLALTLAETLQALSERTAENAEQAKQIKSLGERIEGFEQRMKSLEEADTARKALLPRAVQQALTQRASEKGAAVSDDEVKTDAQKQAALLNAEKQVDSAQDPLGWMAQMAGVNLGATPK